jgi:hypothetical protein
MQSAYHRKQSALAEKRESWRNRGGSGGGMAKGGCMANARKSHQNARGESGAA